MIKFNTYSYSKPLFDYLQKKRQDQKFLKSIELSLTFLLISFFLIFAIRPTAFTIAQLLGEIKSKQAFSRHQLKPKIQNIIQAQDNFAQIQQSYQIIESSLPDQPSYRQAATQILGSAQAVGLPLQKVGFQIDSQKSTKSNSTPLNQYSISANSPARFTQVVQIISQLLGNRRLIQIDKISLSSQADSLNPQTNITFNINGNLFYWSSDEKN